MQEDHPMPRKAQPPKEERQRIQFAYNADIDSPTGVLFQYLIKNERARSREGKHKGIDAISAFWKPFAYQEQGQLNPEELQAIAREAVEQLSKQMLLINETFGLEASTNSKAVNMKQEIRTAVTEALQQMLASGAFTAVTTTPPEPTKARKQSSSSEEAEGVDFDEDALLGDLLDDATIAA
jgi:hypothetical protein